MAKKPNARQLEILRLITPEHPFCYGGDNHYFFSGQYGPGRIHAGTGFSIVRSPWVKARKRRRNQPFWLTEYDLSEKGRQAIAGKA